MGIESASKPSRRIVGIAAVMCLGLVLQTLLSLRWLGPTQAQTRIESLIPLTAQEYISLRRNYFFGHKEISDILTGLNVIAVSVDLFQLKLNPSDTTHPLRLRFEDALVDVKDLSRFSLGMNEIYTLPAMYLFFEQGRTEDAIQLVDLGAKDPRVEGRLLLLGGFISHVFLRDAQRAGQFYRQLSAMKDVPPWVGELADKLISGRDPFVVDPSTRESLCRVVKRAFARVGAGLKRRVPECFFSESQQVTP